MRDGQNLGRGSNFMRDGQATRPPTRVGGGGGHGAGGSAGGVEGVFKGSERPQAGCLSEFHLRFG